VTGTVYEAVGGRGRGGDGLLTILKTLSFAALASGYKVAYSSDYNPETRGSRVEGCTIFSSEDILSPVVEKFTAVVAFDDEGLASYLPLLEKKGLLLWNSSVIQPTRIPRGIQEFAIPVNQLAVAKGFGKQGNMIMLGAFAKITGRFSIEQLVAGMERYLPVWRRGLIPRNREILAEVFSMDFKTFKGGSSGSTA